MLGLSVLGEGYNLGSDCTQMKQTAASQTGNGGEKGLQITAFKSRTCEWRTLDDNVCDSKYVYGAISTTRGSMHVVSLLSDDWKKAADHSF